MNTFVENVKKKLKIPSKKTNNIKKAKKKGKVVIEDIAIPGIVFVSNMPHGFYESEVHSFFSQFGKILRFRLARSRKTGRAKGYAYIEFKYEEVAKIVANTMNNYLFFDKLLKCQFVPPDSLPKGEDGRPKNVFIGWKNGMILASEKNRKIQNKFKTDEGLEKGKERRSKRLKKLQCYLEKKGLNYDMSSFVPNEE